MNYFRNTESLTTNEKNPTIGLRGTTPIPTSLWGPCDGGREKSWLPASPMPFLLLVPKRGEQEAWLCFVGYATLITLVKYGISGYNSEGWEGYA